ncbi:MAG: ABC transporter substrate-binding protein [Chloroflexi bacterium]|nr:ABC transporter substrate-binding protein [Chloroflexota bacterium]
MHPRLRLGLLLIVVLVIVGTGVLLVIGRDNDDDDDTVVLFMSYIPSVQFAPVYVAAERGYFEDEGIEIRFEHGNEADGVERIASDNLQFGLVSGE